MVKLSYAGTSGSLTKRTVQPYRLAYKARAWYLKAFCMEKQALRIFKLSRIFELEILEEGFPYRSFPEQEEASEEDYPEIVLRFPGEMAYRVYDEFDRTQVTRQENGDLIASAHMPVDEWLTGFLLSFGTQVEILSPAFLREAVAGEAKEIWEKNQILSKGEKP